MKTHLTITNFLKQFTQLGGPFCLFVDNPDNKGSTNNPAPPANESDASDKFSDSAGVALDEVNRRIESARQEEKAKLYEELHRLQTSAAESVKSGERAALTVAELTKQVDEAKTKYQNLLDSQVQSKDGKKPEVDIENLVKKTADTATSTLTKQYDKRLAAMQDQLDQANAKAYQLEISKYRDSRIASANGEIIAELVTGTTVEEIDRSFDIALKSYQTIVQRVSGSAGKPRAATPPPSSPPAPPSQPVDPVSAAAVSDQSVGSRRFGRAGQKEYAGVREKLMADMQKRYPRRNTVLVQQ